MLTRMARILSFCLLVILLYVFVGLAQGLRKRRQEEALRFAGAAVFLATVVLEAFFNSFRDGLRIAFLMDVSKAGMMACVYIHLPAMVLQFTRVEQELSLFRETERPGPEIPH